MATGIDDNHLFPTVVGYHVSDAITHQPAPRAFRWVDANGDGQADASELVMLGTLGGDFSTATAINAHGQVVGEAERGDGSRRAFLWSAGIMMEVGDDLMPSSWALLSLAAINDRGQLDHNIAGTARHAVLVSKPGLPLLAEQGT